MRQMRPRVESKAALANALGFVLLLPSELSVAVPMGGVMSMRVKLEFTGAVTMSP